MFILTDAQGRSLGLPAYRSRKSARAAARALSMVCCEAYGVKLVGGR
ncbi:hypothetical protein [Phenylobacterium sp.]|nr:hypothetical protein [Phenylobacterium sp.]MDP3869937.1 hypothetical protein [Phenylobacterium sp.]